MRYFSLTEADRLIPEVERHLRDALFHRAEYERFHQQIEATLDRVRMSGGARIDPGKQLELRANRDTCARSLQEAMGQIEQMGALVKDLDIGLLDFMARYRGQDVCLCWKLGEGEISYWHGAEEGFRGRKLIDEEFRENHSGEALGDTSNDHSGETPN